MKKIITALVAVLLVWNVVLTVEYFNLKKRSGESNVEVVNNVVNGYTTDITDVVKQSEEKVVCVSSYVQEDLFASGSGIVYSNEGETTYIVTNNHVIEGGSSFVVTFDNGEALTAQLIAVDAYTDLALLSVEPDFNVEPFKMGDSSFVKKGEYVIAIGTPLGLDFQGSVSFGVVSGVDRTIPVDINSDGKDDWDMVVLQTDAAINPGNSGGPLINLSGEVIGITTNKINDSSIEGMGFAIESNEVVEIINQLIKNKEVTRPYFGVSGKDIDRLTVYQKSYLGIALDTTRGILVSEVIEDSPAYESGIQVGDVITKIDENKVDSFKTFRKILYNYKVADKVSVSLIRDGNEMKVEVPLR